VTTSLIRADGSGLTFDAVPSYSLAQSAIASDHPVELGANITDHVQELPETININGIIVDGSQSLTGPDPISFNRPANARLWLQESIGQLLIVDIQRIGQITNFVLTRAQQTGTVLKNLIFDVELKQIVLPTSGTIQISVAQAAPEAEGYATPQDVGEQPTIDTSINPAAEAADKNSLLLVGKHAVEAVF